MICESLDAPNPGDHEVSYATRRRHAGSAVANFMIAKEGLPTRP